MRSRFITACGLLLWSGGMGLSAGRLSLAPGEGTAEIGLPVSTLGETRADLEWLKSGLTRGEVETRFARVGGIFFPFSERYYLRDVKLDARRIILELSFKPADMPEAVFADEKLRVRWLREHPKYVWDNAQDVLRTIGIPRLSELAID